MEVYVRLRDLAVDESVQSVYSQSNPYVDIVILPISLQDGVWTCAETEDGMREVGIYLHVDWCRDLKRRGVREKQVSSTTSPRSNMQTFPNLP